MKKLFIILLISLSFGTALAQNDSIPDITETERIIDKYGEKIIGGFEKVVAEVTPVAEQGFEMVVKLQIARGFANLTLALLSLFLIIFSIAYRPFREFALEETGGGIYIVLLVPVVAMVMCGYDAFMYLLAPEWFAIKEIMKLF